MERPAEEQRGRRRNRQLAQDRMAGKPKGSGLGRFLEAPAPPAQVEPPARTGSPRGGKLRGTPDGRVQTQVYMHPDGKAELKKLAIELNRSMYDLVVEAANDFLQKHGKQPLL